MKTVTIQIGNSDNKLTQGRWARYIHDTHHSVIGFCERIHFSGFSAPTAIWQNAAWVLDIEHGKEILLRERLSVLADRYNQDSIAWTEGQTEFIKPI